MQATAGTPNSPLQRRQARLAWFFLAPTLLLLLAVGLWPLLQTIYLSFTDGFTGSREPPRWIAFGNYTELARDPAFWRAVWNTVLFTAVSVSLEFVLGLGFALLVHSHFKGRGLMRAAMLIPWALPTVVAAQMWRWMFNDVFGVVNDLLVNRLGILAEPVAFTGTPGWAMASVILVDVWKTTPFVALLLLAGLQLISGELYEAAEVDGASRRQAFLAVTLPLLKPAILVALIFRTLDALRVFDVIWVMTRGQSGTESVATHTYRNLIEYSRLGYGSALSVMVFLLIALFVAIYVRLLRVDEEASS